MKFIIVTQTFPPRKGGMQLVMKGLSEGLSEYGEVIIFLDHSCKEPVNSKKFTIKMNPTLSPKIIRPYVKYAKLFFQDVNREDIFICDSWKSVSAIPGRYSNKIVTLAHGQEYLDQDKNGKKIKLALSRSNILISTSAYTKNLIEKYQKKIMIKIIPPTYAMQGSLKISKKVRKKNEFVNLFSLTRIERRKGLFETMSALSVLIKNNNLLNWHWTIAGDGPDLNELKRRSKELGLDTFVTFCGKIDETKKSRLFSDADLFVMPSYRYKDSVEGFGIVYIEAAMYGIPSIGGEDGGITDAIDHNVTGWLVNPLKEDKLIKLLKKTISSSEERKLRGIAANKNYNKKFKGTKTLKMFIEEITA